MRGLLQKAPRLPSHRCPRRGGERQLEPGERLPSRGRVRAGRVGRAWGPRLSAGGAGAANAGGGGAGLRGPAAALGSRPRAEGGPGSARARRYGPRSQPGERQRLLGQSRSGRRCHRPGWGGERGCGSGSESPGDGSRSPARAVHSRLRAGAIQRTSCSRTPSNTRTPSAAQLLGTVRGAAGLTGCLFEDYCYFKIFTLRVVSSSSMFKGHGYFVTWRVTITRLTRTCWPILVNKTVTAHWLKWWGVAPLPTAPSAALGKANLCFSRRCPSTTWETPCAHPEAAPLKGKTVHRAILIH